MAILTPDVLLQWIFHFLMRILSLPITWCAKNYQLIKVSIEQKRKKKSKTL